MPNFAADILKSLGAPTTKENVRFFNAWARAEGTAARFNPLATTRDAPGATAFNSVGVRNYSNYGQGLNSTRDTLLNGHYNTIVSLLKSGRASATQLAQAVAASPWGTGSGVLRVLGSPQATGDLVYRPGAPGVPSVGALIKPLPMPKYRGPNPLSIAQAMGNPDPGAGLGSITQLFTQSRLDFARAMKTYRQQLLKRADTGTLQGAGIVSPGGDLKDPGSIRNSPVCKIAATQIGKPYLFGSGPDTSSFDCSDLIQWSYKQAGIALPRTTFQQVKMGRPIDPSRQALEPGDLVFPSPHHVVMYVGNGKVIAAPHTGTVVQYQPLANFGKLYAVRRILSG